MTARLAVVLSAAFASAACIVVPAPTHSQSAAAPTAAPAGRSTGVIEVVGATYGLNCGAPRGNATGHVARGCNGKSSCKYTVDFKVLGDPAPGCQKAYQVGYRCEAGGPTRSEHAKPEAGFGSVVVLDCK